MAWEFICRKEIKGTGDTDIGMKTQICSECRTAPTRTEPMMEWAPIQFARCRTR